VPSPTFDLTTADLESFSKGKLLQNDRETHRFLLAALSEVRNYCRWHVTPVHTAEQFLIDGPGDPLLYLPTKYLRAPVNTAIASIIEDGVTLDVSTLEISQHGLVRKQYNRCWSSKFSSITVTITHGYTEAESADWRRIVLAVAERMSMLRGLVGRADMTVGPYQIGAYDPDVNPYEDLFEAIDVDNYVRLEV